MDVARFIPFATTVVTLTFAGLVIARYRSRGGTHHLLWGIGLLWYALGTGCEALLSLAYSPWVLKGWYLAGAMLTAAWLGQGTLFLLVRRRWLTGGTLVLLVLASLGAALVLMASPLKAGTYHVTSPASGQYSQLLTSPPGLIALTIILNLYGTILLVGGALLSAWLFWRKQVLANRVLGNILIAVGAFFPALAGTFLKLGLVDWLYVSELLGSVVMYLGFLVATSRASVRTPTEAGHSAAP
jgi:hypothetical protein